MSSPYTSPELEKANIKLPRPLRKCIITGEIADKAVLIRFVVSPDGELVTDTANKLGGRGVWVSAVREIKPGHIEEPVQQTSEENCSVSDNG